MPLIRFQLRRGTAAEWAALNPVLADGEPGVETNTGQQKLGNGVTAWNALPYVTAGWQGVQDALQARTDAQAAAGTAAGHVTAAAGQVALAAGQVTLAAGQVALATTAKTAAETARTGAQTAKADAESARNDAQTARTGAETAKTGAETARTAAQTAKAQAETARDAAGAFYGTTVVVGAVDSQGHLVLTRSNGTTADAGYVVGPPITASVTGTVTGPDTPGIPGAPGLPGPTGPAGGIVLGTQLFSATDLNSILTAGVYRQVSGSSATYNYPTVGKGILIVHVVTLDTLLTQEWIPDDSGAFAGKVTYRRRLVSGVWSAWSAYNSTRVDQAAGRAIYQWDDVNNREQLVYGDTGWRDVNGVTAWTDALFVAGSVTQATSYAPRVRRVGQMVELHYGIDKAAAGPVTSAAAIPLGFRPVTGASLQAVGATSGLALFRVFHAGGVSTLVHQSPAALAGGSVTLTYSTNDPWPTTLPGVAVSTIPNL